MKKFISVILLSVLLTALFIGCGTESDGNNETSAAEETAAAETSSENSSTESPTAQPETSELQTETETVSDTAPANSSAEYFKVSSMPKEFAGTLVELAKRFDYLEAGNYSSEYSYGTDTPQLVIKNTDGKKLNDCALTYKIDDFDSDGEDELLIITAQVNANSPNFYMYESDGKVCRLAATMSPVAVDCEVDEYDCKDDNWEDYYLTGNKKEIQSTVPFWDTENVNVEILTFRHEGELLIFVEHRDTAVYYGDGRMYYFSVIEYDDGEFECEGGYQYGGSFVEPYIVAETDDELREYIPSFSMDTMVETDSNTSDSMPDGSYEKLLKIKTDADKIKHDEEKCFLASVARLDNFIN